MDSIDSSCKMLIMVPFLISTSSSCILMKHKNTEEEEQGTEINNDPHHVTNNLLFHMVISDYCVLVLTSFSKLLSWSSPKWVARRPKVTKINIIF